MPGNHCHIRSRSEDVIRKDSPWFLGQVTITTPVQGIQGGHAGRDVPHQIQYVSRHSDPPLGDGGGRGGCSTIGVREGDAESGRTILRRCRTNILTLDIQATGGPGFPDGPL